MQASSWGFGRLILWVCLAVFAAGSAQAEKRIALVIANEAYTAPNLGRLPGTKTDAQRIAAALVKAGFPSPRVVTDVSRDALRTAVADFVRQLTEAGPDAVGFFYYSGHGIADSRRGQNYLIPVDANFSTAAELPLAAEPLDEALDAIEGSGARSVFVVIDACRNTPTSLSRGSKGLLPTRARSDTLVAFATAPGETAADDGIYSRILADELSKPGANSVTLFAQVQQAVARATGRRQVPQFLSSLVDPVEFVPTSRLPNVATTVPVSAGSALGTTSSAETEAIVADCVRLTADFSNILSVLAIPACTKAVTVAPTRADLLRRLGNAHYSGQNFSQSVVLYKQAAALGDGGAMNNLGWSYINGQGVPQDYAAAKRWYEQAAAKGEATAMNNLGVVYRDALGVARDYSTARRWFEQAADRGNPAAMVSLGVLHANGQGAPRDYAAAKRWYEQAAAKDQPLAMHNLGALYRDALGVPRDYATARRWFEQAAAKGEPLAMISLGALYRDALGVPQDYATARRWFEQAAAKGDPLGMTSLGALYAGGKGVPLDYTQAKRWYEQAAAKGDPLAMHNLGALYRDALGVPQDYATARRWFEQGAVKGDPSAMTSLGALYHNAQGAPRDYTAARRWYEQAAAKDNAVAMENLGLLYQYGLGVPPNVSLARSWYERSAALGRDSAKSRLSQLPK